MKVFNDGTYERITYSSSKTCPAKPDIMTEGGEHVKSEKIYEVCWVVIMSQGTSVREIMLWKSNIYCFRVFRIALERWQSTSTVMYKVSSQTCDVRVLEWVIMTFCERNAYFSGWWVILSWFRVVTKTKIVLVHWKKSFPCETRKNYCESRSLGCMLWILC